MKKLTIITAAGLMLVAAAPKGDLDAFGLFGSGATLNGSVVVKGNVPAPKKILTWTDPACEEMHPHGLPVEDYVVGKDGGLKNVFVYVKKGLEGKTFSAPTDPVRISQNGCQFSPRVMGVQTNQPLEIVNEDATLHNVNAQPKNNTGFNFAEPTQGTTEVRTFQKPEVMVPFVCNVHSWMTAYVGVVDHPFFAVSDGDGRFQIKGLPAGTYVLEAWHEKLGTAQQTVTVKAGESTPVSFVFTMH